MPVNKRSSDPMSKPKARAKTASAKTLNKRRTASRPATNLSALDAHRLTADAYDEIPELTEADAARGVTHQAGIPVKRGRPKSPAPKVQINIRLSPSVLEHFKADGAGWQSRIDEALQAVVAGAHGAAK